MALRLAPAVANAHADDITTRTNAGAGPGTLKIYTGALPSNLAPTTLLATFTLADPAAAGAIAGVATWDFDPAISTLVVAEGVPGWFLVEDSDGVDVYGGTVGTSGADLNFTTTTWLVGGTVRITSGSLTQPQGA